MRGSLVLCASFAAILVLTACSRPREATQRPPPTQGPLSAVGESGLLRFHIELIPAAPIVGELFEARVGVMAASAAEHADLEAFFLDATMPHHGHGMVTQPEHERLTDGRFHTRGLKLHMPGEWTFVVGGEVRGQRDEARILFHQPPGRPR